jgi:nicotinamidase-related amidase
MLIDRAASRLLLVDVQDRLLPVVDNQEELLRNALVLSRSAFICGVPTVVSEQYPEGLGSTVPELSAALSEGVPRVSKVGFSCLQEQKLADEIRSEGKNHIIVSGIEAHVCVLQTAVELVASGMHVFVVCDAVGSRKPQSKRTALRRMFSYGINIVTTEMVVFEWLRTAKATHFQEISRLIR